MQYYNEVEYTISSMGLNPTMKWFIYNPLSFFARDIFNPLYREREWKSMTSKPFWHEILCPAPEA
jgi:hypothetical protein